MNTNNNASTRTPAPTLPLGLYQATPPTPFVPGLECCGVVEAVGPPATNLPEGTVVPQV